MSKTKRVLSVQLRVLEAKSRDVGKGRARIDPKALEILGAKSGGIVELIGRQSTASSAWPLDPEDAGSSTIRIDGQTRKNAGVALNDFISVRKAHASPARSVTLTPLGGKVTTDRDFASFVRNRLKSMVLCKGDDISVVVLGGPILFKVTRVSPRGIIKVDERTKLVIQVSAAEEEEKKKVVAGVTYDDVGGLGREITRLREIVELPLRHPEVFKHLGIEPPSGVLLYGPPGCGKTLMAKALASESEATFFSISGPEIMNKYYGETEARLREIFKEAKENAPSIIFIDEIDAIAPKREETFGDVEKRVVAQLLSLMDGLSERSEVVVIGATNRPESVDPALRRAGRFDREVEIGVPNIEKRMEILQIHTRGMPLREDVDLNGLAEKLHGYTGADIRALCREAGIKALKRSVPQIDLEREKIPPSVLETMVVTVDDFMEAYKEIVPTAMREFYVESPRIRWSEIGGLEAIKRSLEESVIWAMREPHRFTAAGVKPPEGVLLYGPPGCGKTLLARAVASESGANFITVRGPEILSKWVGESERGIREIFRKAKASAPCIVFFDEVDSLAPSRGGVIDDSGVGGRVLSQLLTEMDGAGEAGGVFVVAATNRPDLLDMSLLRPGRFDQLLYVPPPEEPDRLGILRLSTSRMKLSDDVSLDELARSTKGYSGADLEGLCRRAAVSNMRRSTSSPFVTSLDFQTAMKEVPPSLSPDVTSWYESIDRRMKSRLPRLQEGGFYA